MLFRPNSEKVRVWVWRKSGKGEVDDLLGSSYEGK